MTELFKAGTFRLAVLFALAVTAATSVVFLFIYWRVATFDVKRVEVRLVDEITKAISDPEDRVKREIDLRLTSDLRRLDYAGFFDKDGKVVTGNVAALPKGLPIDGAAHSMEVLPLRQMDAGTEPALLVAGRRADGGIVLLGRSLYEVFALRQLVGEALLLGVAPTIILALFTGVIFSLRSARRLKAINQTIMRIMQGDLNERLPTRGKMDDIEFVAGAVNLMLDEIVRLLGQIKSVGDNIAHDLRTPLAVMQAQLERGLAGNSEQDVRIAAKRALVELDRAMTTVTALLRISEIEFGRRRSEFTHIELDEICRNAFELYAPFAEAKSIGFTLEAPTTVPFFGDFDLLMEAVANLIDNAIKFTPRGGAVKVTVKMADDGPLIRVSDTGPGIPPNERAEIFKRFYRSEKCRHIAGTGLGLSMASTITHLHGLDLHVEDNNPGSVFEISSRQMS
ncbi:sensor histidine kinase [Methylocapsa acidiphila]|uniref:sensor histidine kinase n=1 Tax=Methylocapsa acidiphila TaxID=133552 RepID=UPI000400E859|nr:HAMP domain-containing sensor histidine kinase [Methylocapsa acidiphila]